MLMEGEIRFSVESHVAVILIDRPNKRNAITSAMAVELRRLSEHVNSDDSIRVVIITGAGDRAFCAGTDVNGLDAFDTPWALSRRPSYTDAVRGIHKVVIAAINGFAYGGGLELALNCDIRICSSNATFAAPEVKLGWIGGGGMTALLAQSIGTSNTALMLATGQPIGAEQALSWSLVSEVVPFEDLDGRARAIAEVIGGNPPIATAVAKRNLRAVHGMSTDDAIKYELDLQTMCFYTEDAAEGRRAFAEKRPGHFLGR
jgi:enoyl-CoA hydratase/carnithine racemase